MAIDEPSPSREDVMNVDVKFLDGNVRDFGICADSKGLDLFVRVCEAFNVDTERDYFGLEYQDTKGTNYWLDHGKRLKSQLGLKNRDQPFMEFVVKFYVPDPTQLFDEYTKYLYALQIRKDLSRGEIVCPDDGTRALICAHIVQATLGDYVAGESESIDYLSRMNQMVPKQTPMFEELIKNEHKKLHGKTPLESDLDLLQLVRTCQLYGVKIVPCKDAEGVSLNLAVAHMGILVLQDLKAINTFPWSCIRKICFKKNRFFLKFYPTEGYGYYKDCEEISFASRDAAKSFWKRCIETHSFFCLTQTPRQPNRQSFRLFSRGSMFRYSGRTQQELRNRDLWGTSSTFGRNRDFRLSRSTLPTHISNPASTSSPLMGNKFRITATLESLRPDRSIDRNSLQTPTPNNDNNNEDGYAAPEDIGAQNNQSGPKLGNLNPDRGYLIAKELLLSERTYKRDLEMVLLWFRNFLDSFLESEQLSLDIEENGTIDRIFRVLEPIYERHCSLLKIFEQCVASMEGRPVTRGCARFDSIASSFLEGCVEIDAIYEAYVQKLGDIFEAIELALQNQTVLGRCIESFEMTENCYLPLSTFLTKPFQRLHCYRRACHQLIKNPGGDCGELKECERLHEKLDSLIARLSRQDDVCARTQRIDLVRDLRGFDGSSRLLLEGPLTRVSVDGVYDQLMFFLFEDRLVAACRFSDPYRLRFSVEDELLFDAKPVAELCKSPHSNESSSAFSFSLKIGQRKLVLATAHDSERRRWVATITNLSVGDISESKRQDSPPGNESNNTPEKNAYYSRCHTISQVCWLRQLSFGLADRPRMFLCLSGYLLRKFKHSTGWQKLWVVLSDLNLFFFKTYQDSTPLACLPILGYEVCVASKQDSVRDRFVIKLSFRSHVYFLRAECRYTFDRWYETFRKAVQA